MTDGQIVQIENIKSIKAIPHITDTHLTLSIYNDENDTHPVASFCDIVGYQLIGRVKVEKHDS